MCAPAAPWRKWSSRTKCGWHGARESPAMWPKAGSPSTYQMLTRSVSSKYYLEANLTNLNANRVINQALLRELQIIHSIVRFMVADTNPMCVFVYTRIMVVLLFKFSILRSELGGHHQHFSHFPASALATTATFSHFFFLAVSLRPVCQLERN